MASKLDIPLHGASVNIVRRCRRDLSSVLESKFGCVPIIEGVEFEGVQKRQTVVPEERLVVLLSGGIKLSVWKADLTDFQVDAVVNAANTRLQHCGGLASALSCAGGPEIQRESDDYITKKGKLKTGDAVVTGAGLLPCKKIIHAVGPELQPHPSRNDVSGAEPQLKTAIRNILDRVKENHLQTVAIPAISSGLFHYPLPDCANAIVSTVKSYYERSSPTDHLPKEIRLANNDEPSVKEMVRACREILHNQKPTTRNMSYSQAAASKSSRPTVQIGNVHMTLKWGKIEEQQADVIVNTVSADLNLQSGVISKALLQKAGDQMQWELNNATPKGHIIVTKGYKLQCREVYHTCCPDKQWEAAHTVLFSSVLDCLWTGATRQHKSVAFPAIGTGGLGFSKKEVARIMSEAVARFATGFPERMEVYFVIFPSDNETFEAFEQQMRFLQQQASHHSFTEASQHREDAYDSKPPAPQISLSGPSDEQTREAERWLRGLLRSSGPVTIRNNFIQHFGEQEYLQLSRLSTQKAIFIYESFEKGHAAITVRGESHEDVVGAGLQVEAMLCKIQEQFVREEALLMSMKKEPFERKPVDPQSRTFSDRSSEFKKQNLWILKVEAVENSKLKTLFDLKKNQLKCFTPQKMFQRVPAQFCEMVSHIGFHAEYAPPSDPAYGEGIYFTRTAKKAMEVWKEPNEEYLYLVEAEVLTGNSTPGKPGLILPPPLGKDPQIMFDSVEGGSDICVIFSSYQALPKYIITCKVI